MAKITLIAKSIGPEVLSLVEILNSRKDEVVIITDQKCTLPMSIPCPVRTPFKNWSFSETLKLFPRLIQDMPDVIHFVFSEAHEVPTRADWLLTRLIQPFPRRAIVGTFFYSPRELSSKWARAFLAACHGVSWGSPIHLLQAKRAGFLSETMATEVIAPFWTPALHKTSLRNEDLDELIRALQPYVLVPGPYAEFLRNTESDELFFDQGLQFVFQSKRSRRERKLSSRFFVDSTSEPDTYALMKGSRGVLLAFNEFSLSKLQQFWIWSQELQIPLIVHPEQNQIFPGLVNPGKSGWVLDQGEETLRSIVRDDFRLARPKSETETKGSTLSDSASNKLSRLFTQALALRT